MTINWFRTRDSNKIKGKKKVFRKQLQPFMLHRNFIRKKGKKEPMSDRSF